MACDRDLHPSEMFYLNHVTLYNHQLTFCVSTLLMIIRGIRCPLLPPQTSVTKKYVSYRDYHVVKACFDVALSILPYLSVHQVHFLRLECSPKGCYSQ